MAKKFDAKAQAKRQKIIAAVLGVVLLGALAVAVPSVMSSMNKKPPTATATPPPAAAPTAPGAVPPIAGATPAAAATPVAASTLSDSDPSVSAGTGQLVAFDRFASKDLFAQQLSDKAATASAEEEEESSTDPSPQPAPAPPPPPPASRQLASASRTARISVNGKAESVSVNRTFPQADPVFVLLSLGGATAKVGIAGGSLDTGASAVTLKKGKKVTLMNTANGTRYTLLLVSVS